MNEIDRVQRQVFQRMSPERRLKMGLKMTEDGLRIMDLRLCQQMPESSQGERMAARFETLYKNDLPPDVLQACLEGLRKHWKARLRSPV